MCFLIHNVYSGIQSGSCTDHHHHRVGFYHYFLHLHPSTIRRQLNRYEGNGEPFNITSGDFTFLIRRPFGVLKMYSKNGTTFNVETKRDGDVIFTPENVTTNRKKRFAKPLMDALKRGATAGVGVTFILKYNELKDFVSSYIDVVSILSSPTKINITALTTTITTTNMPKTELYCDPLFRCITMNK